MSLVSPIAVGSVVEGTVTGITNFGAFVLLPNGKTGLVHISEVAKGYVREIRDHIQEQQKVQVKILSAEGSKVALSIRQADPSWSPEPPARQFRERRGSGGGSFEDKMARFMKDSEDRQGDLRRVEGKRGGRGGRLGS